ncbi:hypothetical protein PGT21_004890 [Puccinia graminis f. sp. tritici]|uniref:Uncharacterized protein n=1 Tax=Puccinia graminis f. sp. tritici TaxID=56615 RepID=A0A5B0P714_PUCGR|nr:hypothetical protein PGT21_004890 [Puccinia graminis f. sp. tritici]KAA1134262.1 hypothetical protein PGTUg99_034150 [Puccinia graminis f. sp. tritici]
MPIRFRSTLPTSSTNSRLPISSVVFDRIFDALSTGFVGSRGFSSISRIVRVDWLGSAHGWA